MRILLLLVLLSVTLSASAGAWETSFSGHPTIVSSDEPCGYLRALAGRDTTQLRVTKAKTDPTSTYGDTCIARIVGSGYTTLWDFAGCAFSDSLATITVRVDGGMCCSLTVRDFCGFPGVVLDTTALDIGDGAFSHSMGGIKCVGHEGGPLGAGGLFGMEAFHRIPYNDSLKVIWHTGSPGNCVASYLDLYYHPASIADWGPYRHWHAQIVKGAGTGSTALFDSGTKIGGGVYLGTAIHFLGPVGGFERLVWFKYNGTDSTGGNSTEGHWGGAWYYLGLNRHSQSGRPNDGVYMADLANPAATQIGGYRWYNDKPIYFTSRFAMGITGGAVEAVRAVSFWYSRN